MSEENFETPLVTATTQSTEQTKVSKLPVILSVLALSISTGVASKLYLDTKTTKETSSNLYSVMDKVDSSSGELNSVKQSIESLEKRTLTLENTPHISLKSHKTLVEEVGDLTDKITHLQEFNTKFGTDVRVSSDEFNRKQTQLVELTKNMYDLLIALDAENQKLAHSINNLNVSDENMLKTLAELQGGKVDVEKLVEVQETLSSLSDAIKSVLSGQREISSIENLEVILVGRDKALVKDKLVGDIPFVIAVGQVISGDTVQGFRDGKILVESKK